MALVSRRLRLTLSFGLIAAFFILPFFLLSWAQDVFYPKPEKKWVVQIVHDEKGKPTFVEHKWPFGSVDNIGFIRVPWGYRDLLSGPSEGGQLSGNYHQESLDLGFHSNIYFWALLPDFRPFAEAGETIESTHHPQRISISVSTGISPRQPVWDGHRLLSLHFRDKISNLNSFPVEFRPTREELGDFGLRRIRPKITTWIQNKTGPTHDELLFDAENIDQISTFLVCGADDGRVVPDHFRACKQTFVINEINAVVHLRFLRTFLPEWRRIKADAIKLILSFASRP